MYLSKYHDSIAKEEFKNSFLQLALSSSSVEHEDHQAFNPKVFDVTIDTSNHYQEISLFDGLYQAVQVCNAKTFNKWTAQVMQTLCEKNDVSIKLDGQLYIQDSEISHILNVGRQLFLQAKFNLQKSSKAQYLDKMKLNSESDMMSNFINAFMSIQYRSQYPSLKQQMLTWVQGILQQDNFLQLFRDGGFYISDSQDVSLNFFRDNLSDLCLEMNQLSQKLQNYSENSDENTLDFFTQYFDDIFKKCNFNDSSQNHDYAIAIRSEFKNLLLQTIKNQCQIYGVDHQLLKLPSSDLLEQDHGVLPNAENNKQMLAVQSQVIHQLNKGDLQPVPHSSQAMPSAQFDSNHEKLQNASVESELKLSEEDEGKISKSQKQSDAQGLANRKVIVFWREQVLEYVQKIFDPSKVYQVLDLNENDKSLQKLYNSACLPALSSGPWSKKQQKQFVRDLIQWAYHLHALQYSINYSGANQNLETKHLLWQQNLQKQLDRIAFPDGQKNVLYQHIIADFNELHDKWQYPFYPSFKAFWSQMMNQLESLEKSWQNENDLEKQRQKCQKLDQLIEQYMQKFTPFQNALFALQCPLAQKEELQQQGKNVQKMQERFDHALLRVVDSILKWKKGILIQREAGKEIQQGFEAVFDSFPNLIGHDHRVNHDNAMSVPSLCCYEVILEDLERLCHEKSLNLPQAIQCSDFGLPENPLVFAVPRKKRVLNP